MAIITPQNFKDWRKITGTADDTNVAAAVAGANQAVVQYTGQTFDKTATTSATARVYVPATRYRVEVDPFWETTVLVVKADGDANGTYETTLVRDTDYVLYPLNGLRDGATWPYLELRSLGTAFPCWGDRPSIQVTAAWGWPVIPDAVFMATLLVAGRLYGRQQSPDGVLGGGFADIGPVRVSKYEDPDAARLLDNFMETKVLVA